MESREAQKIIQGKINELNKEYQRVRDLNKSVREIYGSELCAAEMEDKKQEILRDIDLYKFLLEIIQTAV